MPILLFFPLPLPSPEFAETGAAKEEKEMRLVKAMVSKSREVVKGKTKLAVKEEKLRRFL